MIKICDEWQIKKFTYITTCESVIVLQINHNIWFELRYVFLDSGIN